MFRFSGRCGLYFLALGASIAVAAPPLARPLAAQAPIVREVTRLRAFPIEGVNLDMAPENARAVLDSGGFIEVSLYGSPNDPAGWNYEKGDVRVMLRQSGGLLTLIERVERGRADSDVVDIDTPAAHIRSFFALDSGDCVSSSEGLACTVGDDPRNPAIVVTAQLVPHQAILRAALIF